MLPARNTAHARYRRATHALYVVAPSHEQRRLRPLFQTLIASILSATYERASENGGRIDPALLVVSMRARFERELELIKDRVEGCAEAYGPS
jgi:hypothetical protein